MPKFLLLTKVLTYQSKKDKTNSPYMSLVSPSQNIIISDQEKAKTRKGYTLFGTAGSGSDPIEAEHRWSTSSNTTINVRAYATTLQAYFGTVDGVEINAWTDIGTGMTFPSAAFSFAAWWDNSEQIDLLLMVAGTDKIWDWSGAATTIASTTSNTITKNGTSTWAESRFLTAGTRKVIIGTTAYTYTGGETTTTLTGVTGNPTGEAVNSLVFQQIRENDNTPANDWVNSFIRVRSNQLWVGSYKRNEIYVSKDTDFTDYAFASPRTPGEGALLVLDGVGRGFLPLTNAMLVSAGRDDWYQSEFQQLDVGGILSETLKIKKLKTSPDMAAQSQDMIDGRYFVSFESVLREIVGVDLNNNLITRDLSDPIKPDFDLADFTNGQVKVHRTRIYIVDSVNSNIWINEKRVNANGVATRFWQPPQIMPIRRMTIISGLIHGHSSGFNETYKLFNGTRDNDDGTGDVGTPISFNASYAYRNYGNRAELKEFDEVFVEGYIRGNSKITLQVRYDFLGATQTLEKVIDGSDETILLEVIAGLTPLGTTPLGTQEESTQQPKFRVIKEFAPRDFIEVQFVLYSNALDDQWEIISIGANVLKSPNQLTHIKQ